MATYNGSDQRLKFLFQNGGGGGASALVDLSDVSISSPSDGQVLIYDANNGEWVNSSAGSPSSLASLSDVTITSPTTGQVLTYNGSDWVNATGGGSSSHTYSTTEQVVGTWIDGKPLYEQVIHYTTTPTGDGWTLIPLPVDCLVKDYAAYYHRKNPERVTKMSMFRTASPNETLIANVQDDQMYVYITSAFISGFDSIDIILRYTKSSD